jgi:hypothetical protein
MMLGALGWAAVGLASCLLVAPFEPNLLEEGVLLHVAQRLAQGERLYRDVLAFTGPLPFQLLALLFRVFGEEVWVGRAATAVLHAAASGASFWIAQRAGALAHPAAAACALAPLLLFPLFGIYFYTTIAFHLSVLAVAAAAVGSPRSIFAAGLGVAAVALCKQSIGLALTASVGLALCAGDGGRERLRRLAAFVAGGAALTIATLAAFALAGTLPDAIQALWLLPASFDETFASPFPNLWPPGTLAPEIEANRAFYLPYFYTLVVGLFEDPAARTVLATQLLYALPLAGLALTLLRRVRGPLPRGAWLAAALLFTWVANLFPRADWGHLVHVLPPALLQLCVVLAPAAGGRAARIGSAAAGGALTLALLAGAGAAAREIGASADAAVLSARVPLRPVSLGLRGPPVRNVIDFLRRNTRPGEAVFVARAEPLLYFATDTRNPTPYPGVIPGMREEQSRRIVEALHRTRWVVMSDIDSDAMTYYRDELPAVEAELERYYRIPEALRAGEVYWLVVLERGPDRGPTAIDLIEHASHARPFVRSRSGELSDGPRFSDRLATRYNRRPLGFELGERGGGLDFELTVPANAVFQADAGLWMASGREAFHRLPPGSLVRVSIARDGAFTTLAETPVVTREVDFRRWHALEADLAAYAGQRVTLRLELITERIPAPGDIGYLGSPRIALRPERAPGR